MFKKIKKNNRLILICSASIFSFFVGNSYALSMPSFSKLNPYIGVDFSASKTAFKENFGQDFFNKYSGAIDFNFGFSITENIGVEAGYEFTPSRSADVVRMPGDTKNPNGPAVLRGERYMYSSQYKLYTPYVGVKLSKSVNKRLKAFVMVGASYARLKASYTLKAYHSGIPGDEDRLANSKSFASHKIIPVVKVGMQTLVSDHFGIKAFASWKQLSRLRGSDSPGTDPDNDNLDATYSIVKMKNSYGVGFGVFYNFAKNS